MAQRPDSAGLIHDRRQLLGGNSLLAFRRPQPHLVSPFTVPDNADQSSRRTSSFGYAAFVRSKTELRDEILAAARAEFAQYGLAGSRIDRIAATARASKERLYAHFGDKETLFRDVVAADGREYFAAFRMRPDAVAEFVGDVYDLARSHPEHLRMLTWARLEGLTIEPPDFDDHAPPAHALATIEAAQVAGYVDKSWPPVDLLVLLFGIGLAWAQFPDPQPEADDPAVIASRRASAVRAATRIISPASE
jgi:AcrR family transcriptional regulator